MTEPLAHLVLERITAVYGDTIAVESLSLEVGRGELVGLLGPSGWQAWCTRGSVVRYADHNVLVSTVFDDEARGLFIFQHPLHAHLSLPHARG